MTRVVKTDMQVKWRILSVYWYQMAEIKVNRWNTWVWDHWKKNFLEGKKLILFSENYHECNHNITTPDSCFLFLLTFSPSSFSILCFIPSLVIHHSSSTPVDHPPTTTPPSYQCLVPSPVVPTPPRCWGQWAIGFMMATL